MEATMEPVTTSAVTVQQNILARCVCMVLTCGRLGNHRKVNLKSVEIFDNSGEGLAADADNIGAQKKLFAPADLAPCTHVIGSVKQRLRSMSLDGGTRVFGPGTYMLPLAHVTAAEAVIADGQAALQVKVDELVDRLPALIEARKAKLGTLFAAKDYPTANDVRAAFRIRHNFVSFGAPERLEEVSAAAYARAVDTHNALLADAYQDVVTGLRESAALVMRELAHKLRPDANGKPKALQPTALKDLQELLANFPVLNSVAEDSALAGVLGRVTLLAQGMDVQALRQAPGMRAVLLAEAEAAVTQLDHLVASGVRAVDLSDL